MAIPVTFEKAELKMHNEVDAIEFSTEINQDTFLEWEAHWSVDDIEPKQKESCPSVRHFCQNKTEE